MKDYYGSALIEGWYWYTSNEEPDIFYPCFYNEEINEILINNDWYIVDKLKGLWLFKAKLPDIGEDDVD